MIIVLQCFAVTCTSHRQIEKKGQKDVVLLFFFVCVFFFVRLGSRFFFFFFFKFFIFFIFFLFVAQRGAANTARKREKDKRERKRERKIKECVCVCVCVLAKISFFILSANGRRGGAGQYPETRFFLCVFFWCVFLLFRCLSFL